jgi:hypothetical protein
LNSPYEVQLVRPNPESGPAAGTIKQAPTPRGPPRGQPKGHDYGARLSELVFRSGMEEEECARCFNFFKYNFDIALEAFTGP